MNHAAESRGNSRDNAAACAAIASAVSGVIDSLHPFCDIMIIVQDRRVVRVEITNKYKLV
jgi:hypothetical protein